MSGCQPDSSVTASDWSKTIKTPIEAWPNCKPTYPRALSHTLIIPRRSATTLVEYFPTKILKLDKGTLFDLLTLDILNEIDTWIIYLKYNYKHKKVVLIIKSPGNIILRMRAFQFWKHYQNLRHFFNYSTTKYDWAYRHYKKDRIRCIPNMHLLKNEYE